MLKDQEIFDKVVTHLRKQGKKAIDPVTGDCMYRTTDKEGNTLMCAVGCLIPDHKYTPEMEGYTVFDIAFPDVYALGFTINLDLLVVLQDIHDIWEPSYWEQRFAEVARKFGLKYEGVD